MHELLLNFCNWLQNTPVGLWVSGTLWGYPYVRLIHFVGLSLWVGTIVMLDLRLLGVAGRDQSVAEFSERLSPWTWIGLGIAVVGGLLLFSGVAASYLENAAFRVKFPLVLTSIAYHVVIQRNAARWGQSRTTPALAKVAGLIELLLLIAIITAAVEIPNY
jgi:putative copper export protein